MRIHNLALAAIIAGLPGLAAAQAPLAVQSCLGCHGQAGSGSLNIPLLAGRPKADIEAAMAAFRKNERPASIMGRIARGFTDAEVTAMAAYFAVQKPASQGPASQGSAAR